MLKRNQRCFKTAAKLGITFVLVLTFGYYALPHFTVLAESKDTFRVEAENMDLVGYSVESNSKAIKNNLDEGSKFKNK